MATDRHSPVSGHDHIEGQQGEKTNATLAKQQHKEEEERKARDIAGKSKDGRPHEPQKNDHG